MVSIAFFLDLSFKEELCMGWNSFQPSQWLAPARATSPSSYTQSEHTLLSGFDINTFHFLLGRRSPLQAALRASLQSSKLELFCSVIPNAEQVGLVSLGTEPPGAQALNSPQTVWENWDFTLFFYTWISGHYLDKSPPESCLLSCG